MSKGLEKIELLKSLVNDGRVAYDITKYNEWLKTIENELKDGEKAQFKLKELGNFVLKSKALETIRVFFKGRLSLHKRKYVTDEKGNCGYVYFICFDDKNGHIRYPISKEEYYLLKEVLL